MHGYLASWSKTLACESQGGSNLKQLLEGIRTKAMVRDIRCSQQDTIEVDTIVIDPLLHRWDEAQELQGTEIASARYQVWFCHL